MIFSSDGNLQGAQRYCAHYINVFDHAGMAIARVWEFDTETLTCRIGGPDGRVVVAAGFCFVAGAQELYEQMIYTIPGGLLPFVVKMPQPFPDTEERREVGEQWVKEYLKRLPGRPMGMATTPSTKSEL